MNSKTSAGVLDCKEKTTNTDSSCRWVETISRTGLRRRACSAAGGQALRSHSPPGLWQCPPGGWCWFLLAGFPESLFPVWSSSSWRAEEQKPGFNRQRNKMRGRSGWARSLERLVTFRCSMFEQFQQRIIWNIRQHTRVCRLKVFLIILCKQFKLRPTGCLVSCCLPSFTSLQNVSLNFTELLAEDVLLYLVIRWFQELIRSVWQR